MTKLFKTSLLTSVSAAAFSMMVAAPASAFDQVNWTWNAALDETITKTVVVDINLAPTGMVMVEDLQVQIGDVTATSDVHGVYNNQPQEGGLVDLGTQDIQFHYGLGGPDSGVVVLDDEFKSPSVISASVDEGDQYPNINGTVLATIDLGEVEVPATASYDALTELPSIVSAATAVANNTSISSDVSVQLHEGQFAFNSGEGDGVSPSGQLDGSNSNLTAAGILGALALTGNLGQSDIEATSDVSDILNATVDSSATAVANNLTVNVAPASGQDSLAIADIVQFAYADVEATSTVQDVTLNNYTNLGSLDRPIVGSVATAVGNNKSITVASPVVNVTP